jgi:hypothetical protein
MKPKQSNKLAKEIMYHEQNIDRRKRTYRIFNRIH